MGLCSLFSSPTLFSWHVCLFRKVLRPRTTHHATAVFYITHPYCPVDSFGTPSTTKLRQPRFATLPKDANFSNVEKRLI